jgi:nicotinamide-nucleotide amidase
MKALPYRAVMAVVGDELLRGIVREDNASWLAAELFKLGWQLEVIEVLPDCEEALLDFLRRWMGKVDLVFVSGGLGSTPDDKTRTAIAHYLGTPLVLCDDLFDQIVLRHPEEMRYYLESVRASQGAVPQGAEPVFNPIGTALGMCFSRDTTTVIVLPGIPWEFRAMAEEFLKQFPRGDRYSAQIVVVGWFEMDLKEKIAELLVGREEGFSFLPAPNSVTLVISGKREDVEDLERKVRSLVGEDCLPPGVSSLPQAVIEEAASKGFMIASAESCTGGMVGEVITEIPGSSQAFLGSAVCYSNESKENVLGVSREILERDGAVSGLCALSMAIGARKIYKARLAVAITGIAGPEGGSREKPVGTVWFGVSGLGEDKAVERHFSGDRQTIRRLATATALELFWRRLKGA